jgi:CRP-like cAMP-binding protein
VFDAGDEIVRQGDEGIGVYIVVAGRVEVMRDGHSLASLGPDAFFGEMALLDNYRRSATVRAVEPSRCLVIPRADFLAELHSNNELCFDLLVHMSRRVRELESAL